MYRVLTAALLLAAAPVLAQQGQPGAHFIENWDLNGDGQVTVAEATERRTDVFASFDSDDNGLLENAEYALFDEAREADMASQGGKQAHAGMQNATQGMTRGANDLNGDGRVSLEEFTSQAGAWVAQMDRDGDGVVTIADFGRAGETRGQAMKMGQAQGQGKGPGQALGQGMGNGTGNGMGAGRINQ
ncbi:MAG: EF-hand domain-containing protein [Mangrovicoccus sp.]